MDSILLSTSPKALQGLKQIMKAADNMEEQVQNYVEVSTALLIVEIAKRSEDTEFHFPRGKWATIQNIQAAIEEQLHKVFSSHQKRQSAVSKESKYDQR